MLKLQYNFLALVKVLVNALVAIMLIKVFGTSAKADAILLSFSIIGSLELIQLLFVEQFMYFYNDLKVKDSANAMGFFNVALSLAVIVGLLFYIATLLLIPVIIKLFASGLDAQRFIITKDIFSICAVSLVFTGANSVINGILIAENHFSFPYILTIIEPLFILIGLFWCFLAVDSDTNKVAYMAATGGIFQFAVSIFSLRRFAIYYAPRFKHPVIKDLIKNSFSMRAAHNIHNFLFPLITTNILSSFPAGAISEFYYAKKIVDAVGNVSTGPHLSVLFANISDDWSRQNMPRIKLLIKEFLPRVVLPLVSISTITYFFIPYVLRVIVRNNTITSNTISIIQLLFILLALWQIVLVMESPFVGVCVSSKNAIILGGVNSLYIVSFLAWNALMRPCLGIYSIPTAYFLAQGISLFLFTIFALKILGVLKFDNLESALHETTKLILRRFL